MRPIQIQIAATIEFGGIAELFKLLSVAIKEGVESAKPTLVVKQPESKPVIRQELPQRPVVHPTIKGNNTYDEATLLIDTHRASKLLAVSPRKLWQMYNSGEMPKPVRIGRLVRWNYEELREWVNAGCPQAKKRE